LDHLLSETELRFVSKFIKKNTEYYVQFVKIIENTYIIEI